MSIPIPRPIRLVFLAGAFLFACSKHSSSSTSVLCLVTAAGPNMDCGIWQIHIDSGLNEVIRVLQQGQDQSRGLASQGTFIAANLPDSLKIAGAKLLLEIRCPAPGETTACTDLGPSFPWLYVIRGKKALSSND